MNCLAVASCFHNQTIEIIDTLTENVIHVNGSSTVKNIQLVAPLLISIGVFDHIRRAIALSRDRLVLPQSEITLNWRDFNVSIVLTLLNGLSGVPDYYDWFGTAARLDSITKKILDFEICSKKNKTSTVVNLLELYSDELNKSSSSTVSYLLTAGVIAVMACVVASVNIRDFRVNSQLKLFQAHKINYLITYVCMVLFFGFQTYILARFDLNPIELKETYKNCLDRT